MFDRVLMGRATGAGIGPPDIQDNDRALPSRDPRLTRYGPSVEFEGPRSPRLTATDHACPRCFCCPSRMATDKYTHAGPSQAARTAGHQHNPAAGALRLPVATQRPAS